MRKVRLLTICVSSLLGLVTVGQSTVHASTRLHSIPTGLRGTWHRYYSDSGMGKTMHITAHSWKWSINGRYHHVTAYKIGHWHYTFHPKGMQSVEVYYDHEKLYGKHRPNIYFYVGVVTKNESATDQYYKGKKVIKKQSATPATPQLKNFDLSYNNAPASLKDCVGGTVYTDIYGTDSKNPVGLQAKPMDLLVSDNAAPVKITKPGVKLTLKEFDNDPIMVNTLGYACAIVEYNGQTYYVNPDALSPYNTDDDDGGVASSCLPTDKDNVLLKSGQHVNTSDIWLYTNPDTGKEIDYSYSLDNDQWYPIH